MSCSIVTEEGNDFIDHDVPTHHTDSVKCLKNFECSNKDITFYTVLEEWECCKCLNVNTDFNMI